METVSYSELRQRLLWSRAGREDYLFWQNAGREILERINSLLRDIDGNPLRGIGKPKALLGDLKG